MRPKKGWLISLVALLVLLCAQQILGAQVDFGAQIEPILRARCFKCHGADKQKEGLRLDRKVDAFRGGDSGEPGIVPGDSAHSEVFRRISTHDEDDRMPPKGDSLKAEEIALFQKWIDAGAQWVDDGSEEVKEPIGWAFQPIGIQMPPVTGDPWASSPIDDFVMAKLLDRNLRPSPQADRRILIRRLYMDLHGLLPTPEQIDRFVADAQPDAWPRLVDEVLASPRYGERWAQHWLDIVQYADSHGFEMNNPRPNAYHYRDYVIGAFNDDVPYDRFIREQLAGDTVGVDAATGFLVAGPWDQVVSRQPLVTALTRQDELTAMVNTTGTAFLGLTLGCARCHNHKYDPISQRDFYELTAVFAGVRHGERPLRSEEIKRVRKELGEVADEILEIRTRLAPMARTEFQPTIIFEDEAAEVLRKPGGHGVHQAGATRGNRSDPGGPQRSPNVSDGRYSWWSNEEDATFLVYRPGRAGNFRVWLSWGAGWNTHTRDARYVLDADGDSETVKDQETIATVDQQRFADGTGDVPDQSLWSGFLDAGVHRMTQDSAILLKGGRTGSGITADVIVLQGAKERSIPRFRPSVRSDRNDDRFKAVRTSSVRLRVLATNSAEPCIDEIEVWSGGKNVALTARPSSSGNYAGNPKHKLEHINDGKFGNPRSWISNERGRGWVQLDLQQSEMIDGVSWGRDRSKKYADRTPVDYVIEVADAPGEWKLVAGSQDRMPFGMKGGEYKSTPETRELLPQLVVLKKRQGELKAIQSPRAYAGKFEKPGPTHRLSRGNPAEQRESLVPDTIAVLGSLGLSMNAPEEERRIALADWITDSDNPLTSRVMVNRIWHHHFGTGIVATPGDFGGNGASPSHPELLDWLAHQLVQDAWSLKGLHRLILLSKTYRQSSSPNPDGLARDADARLLWRFPPRRLEAESIRDCILQVSGSLGLSMGGPGFSTFKANSNYVRVYQPKEMTGPAEWRRMVYMHKVRMESEPVFGSFDQPDSGQVCPKRSRSTTAIQALNLFNSTFVVNQAKLMAASLKVQKGDPVEEAYRRAFGRLPGKREKADAGDFVQKHGLAAFCRAILNSNELVFLL